MQVAAIFKLQVVVFTVIISTVTTIATTNGTNTAYYNYYVIINSLTVN